MKRIVLMVALATLVAWPLANLGLWSVETGIPLEPD